MELPCTPEALGLNVSWYGDCCHAMCRFKNHSQSSFFASRLKSLPVQLSPGADGWQCLVLGLSSSCKQVPPYVELSQVELPQGISFHISDGVTTQCLHTLKCGCIRVYLKGLFFDLLWTPFKIPLYKPKCSISFGCDVSGMLVPIKLCHSSTPAELDHLVVSLLLSRADCHQLDVMFSPMSLM